MFPPSSYVNVGCRDNKKTALDHMAELAKEQEATGCFRHKPNPTCLTREMRNRGNFLFK